MIILTELGSSSSSPNHGPNHIYEVFLSFRGADTRNGFTDHLYNALLDAGITTFLDDEEIETGEELKPELERAITSSRASIIVLSKNYASSRWCLDELVLILDQKRNFNQIVIPIFYHIEPTDVRKQQKSFGDAMTKHKQTMGDETNAVKKSELAQKIELWKKALTEIADLKGIDSKDRKETEIIKEVVINIHRRFGVPLSITLPHLIGVKYYIESISSWLMDGSCHTVDILTVIGMSGIGKTSLAKYVFQLHSRKFHKSSFIEGINTRCNERFEGLLDLQKQLYGDISKKTHVEVNDVYVYTSKIEKALTREKVFIVLDDVGSLDQLDALLGNKGLHPGSKIIITATDASLTERCALFKSQLHPNHLKVLLCGLNDDRSLKLLCIHAFESHKPKEGYKEVSEKLVKYCQGHPLALEVLGKLLHKRDIAYWEECLKGLKKEPHSCMKKVFKMSFDSLPSNEMELFLHVACFFVGKERDLTETILNACDIETRTGITNLTDRCLLRIRWNNEDLMMHSLIQHMGRDLVRQEYPKKPWKRSRLWCHEESLKVLEQEKGKGNLLGLALDMRMLDKKKLHRSFELKTKSLSNMNSLMLLQLNYVQINGSFENFPEELRWLCMHGSLLKSIPLDLPMENLAALDLSYSDIESFDMSKDKRLLGSLKVLDLSFCEHLHSVGGFLELPALERLIVRKCISLIEVCESIEQCVELVRIDLRYCYKLKKVPISIGKLKKVKALLLDGCSSHESEISTIPRDLKLIAFSLPSSLRILSLANNNLSNESFPKDFISLSMLQELRLDNNPIVSMPNCVRSLPRLEILSMNGCERVISIEHPPRTLRKLSIVNAGNTLRKIKFVPEMTPLRLDGAWGPLEPCSYEIDGMVKIQAMPDVEEKVLHSLGRKNIDFIKERRLRIRDRRRSYEYQAQMYYEFGIFSTIYEGGGMPDWMRCRSKGRPSISFTIPSSPNKVRGLNFCCTVETPRFRSYVKMPWINIKNITKDHEWTYCHYAGKLKLDGKCYTLLSHWMFGPNEMEGGDKVTITVRSLFYSDNVQPTRECGFSVVYDEDGKAEEEEEEEEEEEDTLGYYNSWNHIIGRDLSHFQVTTGVYFLDKYYGCFQEDQEFKAFSENKSEIASQAKRRKL